MVLRNDIIPAWIIDALDRRQQIDHRPELRIEAPCFDVFPDRGDTRDVSDDDELEPIIIKM